YMGVQRGAVVLRHEADALAAAGRPERGQRIVPAAEIVLDARGGILVVEQPEVRLEPERGRRLILRPSPHLLVVVEAAAEVILVGGGAFIVHVHGELLPGTDGCA